MKKYFLGILAIVMAVGFSSYQLIGEEPNDKTEKQLVTTYWFRVNSSILDGNSITDLDATFLEVNGGTAPTDGSCSSGNKYCVVGFTNSAQVNEFSPGEYEIVDSQIPSERPYSKP